jgi:tetratricopeptide (TPR) repeat protein
VEISLSSSTVRFLFGSILAAIIVLAAAASAKTFAADVYFARAGIYEKEGMLERSIGANISAARLNPSEEVYLTGLGQRYLSLSERESWQREAHLGGAQQFFRKSLALNPNSVEARLGLGAALASLGEIKGALGQWRAVLAFDPGQYDAYWYIGQTYESLGLFAEAREAYLSVLRINPQDADARVALDRLGGRE